MIFATVLMMLLLLLISSLFYAVTGNGFLFWATAVPFVGCFLLATTIATAGAGYVALRDRWPVLAGTVKLIWPGGALGSAVVGGGAALIWWGLTTLRDAPSWFALSGSLAWVVLCVVRIVIPPEERKRMYGRPSPLGERGDG